MSRLEPDPLVALASLTTPAEQAVLGRLDLLSNQERAVFVLLGRGMKTKEVAFELAVSVKTAETHLARLRAKLGGEDGRVTLADVVFLAQLWVRAALGVSEQA